MATWVDRCATFGIDAILASVLVTSFTALAMIQCRQPVRRRTWGRLGLLASLLVIPLAWFSPSTRIDLRHPTSSTRTIELHQTSVRNQASGATAFATSRLSDPETRVGLTWQSSWSSTFQTIFVLVYGVGLLLGLGRLSLGLVGTAMLIRSGVAASARSENLLATLPQARKMRRRPQLLLSDRTGRPVLVGFFRPTILIPPDLDVPAAEGKLRLGLLHELAHDEVGDYHFGVLATSAQSVWFFLPQVWWIRSQLRLDAEFLADHRAVGHFGTSYHYAQSLVGIAMVPTEGVIPTGSSVSNNATPEPRAEGFASSLIQRVQMLLKCPFEVEDQAPRRWVVSASLIMLLWTLAASRLSIQDHRDLDHEVSWKNLDEAVSAFQLAELVIAPHLLENRLFDLRFRLPRRFRLTCEVMAEPAELAQMEILGYRLVPAPKSVEEGHNENEWRQIEIVRDRQGREAVRIDGHLAVDRHLPAEPASSLTIRPIPGRITRLRHIALTW